MADSQISYLADYRKTVSATEAAQSVLWREFLALRAVAEVSGDMADGIKAGKALGRFLAAVADEADE